MLLNFKNFAQGPLSLALLAGAICLGSCAPNDKGQSAAEEARAIIQDDYAQIYTLPLDYEISLEDAIQRALHYNLDARIAREDAKLRLSEADLQKLSALPDLTAKVDFITRSNAGSSSSQSTITGVQSLEPSISQDKSRFVSLLEMNWGVLDSVLSIYRSKSAVDRAIIAQERERKVRQNIIMDVYGAYSRAAVGQKMKGPIEEIIADVDEQLAGLRQARDKGDMNLSDVHSSEIQLLGKKERLANAYESFKISEIELKALLSYPLEMPIKLDTDQAGFALGRSLDIDENNIAAYIAQALQNRPEVAEELLNTKIADREIKLQAYETIPGLNILLGLNKDENSFLSDDKWISLTASLAQNINSIITYSQRRERAKQDKKLVEAKRRALVAAIAAQVHIAVAAYDSEKRGYELSSEKANLYKSELARLDKRSEVGLVGGMQLLNMRLDSLTADLNKYEIEAGLQGSVARFVNSIGYDYLDLKEFKTFAYNKHQEDSGG
jgi:outer membrane protein TolC